MITSASRTLFSFPRSFSAQTSWKVQLSTTHNKTGFCIEIKKFKNRAKIIERKFCEFCGNFPVFMLPAVSQLNLMPVVVDSWFVFLGINISESNEKLEWHQTSCQNLWRAISDCLCLVWQSFHFWKVFYGGMTRLGSFGSKLLIWKFRNRSRIKNCFKFSNLMILNQHNLHVTPQSSTVLISKKTLNTELDYF